MKILPREWELNMHVYTSKRFIGSPGGLNLGLTPVQQRGVRTTGVATAIRLGFDRKMLRRLFGRGMDGLSGMGQEAPTEITAPPTGVTVDPEIVEDLPPTPGGYDLDQVTTDVAWTNPLLWKNVMVDGVSMKLNVAKVSGRRMRIWKSHARTHPYKFVRDLRQKMLDKKPLTIPEAVYETADMMARSKRRKKKRKKKRKIGYAIGGAVVVAAAVTAIVLTGGGAAPPLAAAASGLKKAVPGKEKISEEEAAMFDMPAYAEAKAEEAEPAEAEPSWWEKAAAIVMPKPTKPEVKPPVAPPAYAPPAYAPPAYAPAYPPTAVPPAAYPPPGYYPPLPPAKPPAVPSKLLKYAPLAAIPITGIILLLALK